MLNSMIAWLWLGTLLVALPTAVALAWAVQRRFLARYLACLALGLAGGLGLAALFALIGERATYDPGASGMLGNWSGLVGALFGLVVGWVTGAVAGPAVLLRLRGVRLAAGRLVLAILAGIAVSAMLVYALEMFRAGTHPLVYPMRLLAGLSSAATFAALTAAAREKRQPAGY